MKKKIISWVLCTAMLLAVSAAGMTVCAGDYSGWGQVSGYAMGDTVIVDGAKYECTGWWVTTKPPGESWKVIETGIVIDPSVSKRSITVKVKPAGDKIYMGYGTLDDVLRDTAGNTLRNYIPYKDFTLTEGVPIIFYMTSVIPGSWYLATYSDCVLLELTAAGVTVTPASYDWTGIHKKNTCYYKWKICNDIMEITYSNIPTYEQQIFRWTGETQLKCGQSMQLPVSIYKDPQDVVWSSSDDKIISVEENAYLSIRHPGTVTLTASTPDGITQEIKLTANIDLTMKIGKDFALIGASANNIIKTTGYMGATTKIQYLTNSSGTYTTMAPVRFLGESIGYRVDYTEETKQVELTDTVNGNYIVMTLGESEITAYNADDTKRAVFDLPVSVTLIDGSTYVPLRTIAEYSGFHCQFISDEQGDYVILDNYSAGLKQADFSNRIWSFNNSTPQ